MSELKTIISNNILPVELRDIPTIMKGEQGERGRDGSYSQKAYKTYAAMVADKSNIPANTSVQVNNDTDVSKNAYYSYDGTEFTKSDFDPQGILTTVDVRLNQAVESASEYFQSQVADTVTTAIEVTKDLIVTEAKLETKEALNTVIENGGLPAKPFATKAAMEVSDLADGSYAQVTDSTAEANGLYYKEQGTWVKSVYDPMMQNLLKADGHVFTRNSGTVSLNSETNKITFTGEVFVSIYGNVYKATTPQSLDIPLNATQRITYNSTSNTFSLTNTTSLLERGNHYVGVVSRDADGVSIDGFDYILQARGRNYACASSLVAVNSGVTDIVFKDTSAATLNINGEVRITSSNETYLIPTQIVNLPSTTGVYRIEYNTITKAVLFTYANKVSPAHIVSFGILQKYNAGIKVNGIPNYSIQTPTSLNNFTAGKRDYKVHIASNPESINFDFDKMVISIQDNAVRMQYENISVLLQGQELSITKDPRWQGLYYNTLAKTLGSRVVNGGLSEDEVWIGFFNTANRLVSGIDNYSLNNIPNKQTGEWWRREYEVLSGDFDANYTQPTLTSWASWVASNTSHTAVYALYDALMASHPEYITKKSLGTDALGNTLYQYDFKPTYVPSKDMGDHTPKVVLFSSVHGAERAGTIYLYNALKQICDRWQEDSKLEALRWNCHFVVVPIAVPSGFDNKTRKNGSGVDIARNFSNGWKLEHEPSHQYYGGAAPLDQPETVILDKVLRDNKEAVFFGSAHNFGQQITDNLDFIWVASASRLQADLGKNMISRRNREWIKRGILDSTVNHVGFASNDLAAYGNESSQAKYYGIMGGVMEVCSRFWWGSEKNIDYSATATTLGTEVWVNWLLLNIEKGCEVKNALNR